MNVIEVLLDDLHPFDDNPRSIDDAALERLKASLLRFGLFVPLVTWKAADGRLVVIGGNQRLRAMRALRDSDEAPESVPVVVLDCSEADARTIVLRDNVHDGEWEWEGLSQYLSDLVGMDKGFDLDATGFDREVFEELVALGSDPLLTATQPDEDDGALLDAEAAAGESTRQDPGEAQPSTTAKVVIGNLRGRISLDVYERFVVIFDRRSARLCTGDVETVLADLLRTAKEAR